MRETLIKELKKESKRLKAVSDNNAREQIREAFKAKHEIFEETIKQLQGGKPCAEIVQILEEREKALMDAGLKGFAKIGEWGAIGILKAKVELEIYGKN